MVWVCNGWNLKTGPPARGRGVVNFLGGPFKKPQNSPVIVALQGLTDLPIDRILQHK